MIMHTVFCSLPHVCMGIYYSVYCLWSVVCLLPEHAFELLEHDPVCMITRPLRFFVRGLASETISHHREQGKRSNESGYLLLTDATPTVGSHWWLLRSCIAEVYSCSAHSLLHSVAANLQMDIVLTSMPPSTPLNMSQPPQAVVLLVIINPTASIYYTQLELLKRDYEEYLSQLNGPTLSSVDNKDYKCKV